MLCDINNSGSEVYNILVTLNPTKAMGIDSIGPKLLKHCALALFQLLYHLFSLCLTQHYIPEEWHIHQITPIHKLVDRSWVKKYRPIFLLCTVSNVLEKIIYNHIIQFVNNSISCAQFGFLRKRSTLHQLLIFTNCLYDCLNQNLHSDVSYLDFKNEFNNVAHHDLLVKLWAFGITVNLWKWFRG